VRATKLLTDGVDRKRTSAAHKADQADARVRRCQSFRCLLAAWVVGEEGEKVGEGGQIHRGLNARNPVPDIPGIGFGSGTKLGCGFVSYFPSSPRANSINFSTVFQFRAVFTTPMPLSNLAANLEVPKPIGVWM
jgi:hypothetical protein